MNETDKPRGERRRSSRGRRRRSGGDKSAPVPAGAAPAKPQGNPSQNSNKQNKSQRPAGPQGRGKERAGRPPEQARGGRQARRGERPESGRGQGPAPARERFNAPRIVPPTLPKPLCPRCGAPIEDLPSALNDKESGAPIHFDCVLSRLEEIESPAEGEKIVYLGGGRFGLVRFENPGDLKRFRVVKLVQWEEKDKRADWRREVADLYSAT